MNTPDARVLPGLPHDGDTPVFEEPWQAQAFALAVQLNAKGAFTWAEWAETLGRELAAAPLDDGARYYHHWVSALERISAERNLADFSALKARKAAWVDAYRRTPHGQPVELPSQITLAPR